MNTGKNNTLLRKLLRFGGTLAIGLVGSQAFAGKPVIHDAEYYILEAQNGKIWAVEDKELDKKLAELRKKYDSPPNIIHYMWDDQPVMSFGDPIYQKIRGYDTPNLNRLAEEGMLFSRMVTEPGCTPSRSAVLTGQLAIRTGTWEIGFPIEYTGLTINNKQMNPKIGFILGACVC